MQGQFLAILTMLALISAANAAPILARQLMGMHLDWPLDFGRCFIDGNPLFGSSKTWRGVLVAIVITGLLAALLGYAFSTGVCVGALAMLGDLLASFVKRRYGLAPSSRATLLDQVPESLVPALYLYGLGLLDLWGVVTVVTLFTLLDLFVSPLLFWLHIRKRPY